MVADAGLQRGDRRDPHLFDHVALHVENVDIVVADTHPGAGFRDLFQLFEQHTVDGASLAGRQGPS